MKASEIRQKTDEELAKQLTDCREQIFKLRLKVQTGELKDTAKIGTLRKDAARLMTIQSERAAAKSANN